MSYLVSKTARQSGYGTARWKTVTRLTPFEREAVREGIPVYFKADRPSGGNHGTYWRVAKARGNGYIDPRVPSAEEVEMLNLWNW